MSRTSSHRYGDWKRRHEPPPETRRCDWPGCEGQGEHRAPKSRERLKDYFWFCLEHVRRYNASWNYFDGMSDAEVEADRRRDTVWQRPSWRLGDGPRSFTIDPEKLKDPMGVFFEAAEAKSPVRPVVRTPEEEALAVLDLRPPVEVAQVKARYKELVKLHHPDANAGDKAAEERFKAISEAYRTVMRWLGP
ncbi:MAG: J domain-containing protein [Magnetospirillum sp. WYHS-4]